MTTEQIQTRIALYSNETLRVIVASNARKWAFMKWHARQELVRRDHEVTFAEQV